MHSALKYLFFSFGLCFVVLCNASSAYALDIPKIVKSGKDDVAVLDRILIFEDREAKLSPAQVLKKQSEFVSIARNNLHKGYSDSAIWVLFQVENKSQDNGISLASTYPVLDIEAYRIVGTKGQLEHVRRYQRRIPSIQLPVTSGSTETFLMRVTSPQFLVLNFYLTTLDGIVEQENNSNMLYALIFGCFLTAFLTNFALFVILRYRSYLYYLLFSFINCHLVFMAIKFPSNILNIWAPDVAHAYSTLGAFTTFLFVRNFLQTKEEFPLLDIVMRIFMMGCLVIAGLELYDYSPAYPNFADMYYQIGVVLLITAGIKSVRSGFAPSKYYLVSLFCFLTGIFTYLTLTLGYLPSNIFTLNALVIGQTAEMLLMSLALSSKLKLIERESNRSLMKTQLLKTITHDISNPLSIIKISTEYFQTLGQTRSLAQIDRATRIIENLIHYVHERRVSDTVHISKLTSVAIRDVFEDVRFAYSFRAEAKKVTLHFEKVDEELSIWGQRSTLAQQILGNLISNAIKFSPEGGDVWISAKLVRQNQVLIEIRDQGEGIRPAAVVKLNRNIERNDSTLGTHGETGFGYGISIVKDTLKVVGGRLEIVSSHISEAPNDYGTTVKIVLPQSKKRNLLSYFSLEGLMALPRKLRGLAT